MVEITYKGRDATQMMERDLFDAFRDAGYPSIAEDTSFEYIAFKEALSVAGSIQLHYKVIAFNEDEQTYYITSVFIDNHGAEFAGTIDYEADNLDDITSYLSDNFTPEEMGLA